MEKRIGQPFAVRGMTLQNRICFAPMTCALLAEEDGSVGEQSVQVFRQIAAGGAALLIQGSTSVCCKNRARERQAGIWEDGQIPGLQRITAAVHGEGKKIVLQLQHAGIRSYIENPVCSSAFSCKVGGCLRDGHEASAEEIRAIRREFADAAERAVAAGYDGIELHASHGWLLGTFLNRNVNQRTDEYGQEPVRIVREIFEEIRCRVPDWFVVGIRMGGFEPSLADGLSNARAFERMGFDYLSISNNESLEWLGNEYAAPGDYPHNPMIFSAGEIKKQVKIPVFAAKNIRTAGQAGRVLRDTGADAVLIGRGMLVDFEAASKMLSGREPGRCYGCKGGCRWTVAGSECPGKRA